MLFHFSQWKRLRKVQWFALGHTASGMAAVKSPDLSSCQAHALNVHVLSTVSPQAAPFLEVNFQAWCPISCETAVHLSLGPCCFSWSPTQPCLEKTFKKRKTTHTEETDVGVYQFQLQLTVEKREAWSPQVVPGTFLHDPSGVCSAYGQGPFRGWAPKGSSAMWCLWVYAFKPALAF